MRVSFILAFAYLMMNCRNGPTQNSLAQQSLGLPEDTVKSIGTTEAEPVAVLDTALFDQKILDLVHDSISEKWPVKTDYPLPGALLPFNRIVAYYGNLYSKGMGVLGALEPDTMLVRLMREVKKWQAADTSTHVIPALHYIAVTAQASPGNGNKYRLRMPGTQIDKVMELAKRIDALVFLDIQTGHSTLEDEIPLLRDYLLLPNVHLGIDPEYAMQDGAVPCERIGTFDASSVNYAAEYLAQLVRENHIPPKMLVVHRFTKGMVTNYKQIETRPEVQIIMDMDGFGIAAKKVTTYKNCITAEPVEFAGFKLFYKIDKPVMMTREEILSLYPKPVYIQYQ